MSKKQKYTKGSVTSKDGTIIGYRQMGSGPGIILLHGGAKGFSNFDATWYWLCLMNLQCTFQTVVVVV